MAFSSLPTLLTAVYRLGVVCVCQGTAVNVQCMVFGNRGQGSGTGVAFTRNPATGEVRQADRPHTRSAA